MRIRCVALTAITLFAAMVILTGCSKETSNSTNSNTTNTGNTAASPRATAATTPMSSATPPPTTGDSGATTPTAVFTVYYEALKRKDVKTVKNLFSKGTLNMMEERAKRKQTTLDDEMQKGLEEVTKDMPAALPEFRDEKIDGDKATLEVRDDKKDKWATVHFVREDGQWKLAFDER